MFGVLKRLLTRVVRYLDLIADRCEDEAFTKLPLGTEVYFYSGKEIYHGTIAKYEADNHYDIHFTYKGKPWHIFLPWSAVIRCQHQKDNSVRHRQATV